MLGSYPDYLKLAERLGAKRFFIPEHIWKLMSEAEQWAANVKSLDRAIARGYEFVLTRPLSLLDRTGTALREAEYILSKGYKLSADKTRLLPS